MRSRRHRHLLAVGALLVGTLVGAVQVSVSSFSELADAIDSGASSVLVTTASQITFTHQLQLLEGAVLSISSDVDARLSGGDAVRLFDLACGSKLSLHSITLSHGHAGGNGGVIAMRCGSELALFSTLFSQSQASLGGSIYAVDSNIVMADSSLTLNTATSGGAIFALRSNITATRCTMNQNTAARNGGAIHSKDGSIISISRSSFVGNSATYGGAIEISSGAVMNMTDCSLRQNYADSSGGMIYVGGGKLIPRATMSHCSISHHYSYYGGVIYVDSEVPVITSYCTFNSNSGFRGGVASLYDESSLIISNSSFHSNKADMGGVFAVYADSVVSCTSCTMTSNEAVQDGGAIYAAGSARVATTDCVLSNNTALVGTVSTIVPRRGTAGRDPSVVYHNLGGAAYLESFAVMDVIGCSIHGNSASVGGAFAMRGGSKVTFLSCVLASNRGSAEVNQSCAFM